MPSKVCCNCGKAANLFTKKGLDIYNGYVCADCLSYGLIPTFENHMVYDSDSLPALIRARADMAHRFRLTKRIGDAIEIDEANALFKVNGELFEFRNLLDFAFHSDVSPENKAVLGAAAGGVIGAGGGAAAGAAVSRNPFKRARTAVSSGILGTGVGTVSGAVVGSLIKTDVCHAMYIDILLRDTYTGSVRIDLIEKDTKVHSDEFRAAADDAEKYIAALDSIYYMCTGTKREPQEKSVRQALRPAPQGFIVAPILNASGDLVKTIVSASGDLLRSIVTAPGALLTSLTDALRGSEATRVTHEIEKYRRLADKGTITEEEFTEKKRQLLGQDGDTSLPVKKDP